MGDAHGHGHHDGPHPQAQMTKLGEEMSLRFLKREARLCGFLQKSFLALEKVGPYWGRGEWPRPPCPRLMATGRCRG